MAEIESNAYASSILLVVISSFVLRKFDPFWFGLEVDFWEPSGA